MIALIVKGNRRIIGRNDLYRPAGTLASHYPEMCGVHAELDAWRQIRGKIRGGTAYVAGKHSNLARNPMTNTAPCPMCVVILEDLGIRNAVFFLNGKPARISIRDALSNITKTRRDWIKP